jgi:hypothetical protein
VKLVLQCAACGTHQDVGARMCPTCKATGVEHLRLMFECPRCFALGIAPECAACNPPPLPYEVVEDPEDEFIPVVPVVEVDEDAAAPTAEHAADDFELSVDEEIEFRPDDDFELPVDE